MKDVSILDAQIAAARSGSVARRAKAVRAMAAHWASVKMGRIKLASIVGKLATGQADLRIPKRQQALDHAVACNCAPCPKQKSAAKAAPFQVLA